MNEQHDLTIEQLTKAEKYYTEHQERIKSKVQVTTAWYPPTEIEDKNDPRIWKDEYWK